MKKITKHLILFLLLILAGSSYSNANCVANFGRNVNQYSGLVTFSDSSVATAGDTIHTYLWDFGNGVTSHKKNPVYFYPTPGMKTITLTVTDGSSNNSTTQQLLMATSAPQGCQATYYNYQYDTTLTSTINFFGMLGSDIIPCNDSIVSILWNFGDGTTSNLINPTHTFPNDTIYNIFRTITTANGCTANNGYALTSNPCTITMNVVPNALDATKFDIIVNNTNGNDSINVQGIGSSSNGNWIYVPPSDFSNNYHTFQAQPNIAYLVYVHAENGCSTNTGYLSLNGFTYNWNNVYNVTADFVNIQQGNTFVVDFADYSHSNYDWSVNANLSYSFWDFGDGLTALGNTATHTYAAYNNYTITHIVTDIAGLADTVVRNISVGACNYTFSSSITVAPNNNYVLNANVVGGIGPFTYNWRTVGSYTDSTYNWASGLHTQSIAADHPAGYEVQIFDINGCKASVNQWNNSNATLYYNPHFQDTCSANFAYGIGTSSAYPGVNNAIIFYNEEMQWGELNNPHTYAWTFSDGYVDLGQQASTSFIRPYSANANYTVTLTVTGGGCNSTNTQIVNYTAGAPCNVSAMSSWLTNNRLFNGQYPLTIYPLFAGGQGTYNSYTYLWNNGSTSPSINAYSTGTYCVTITDSIGCSANMCYTYYAPYDSVITLCGNVYNDANNNGVYDGAETPASSSSTLQIVGGGNTYNANIDGAGHYSANVPAGNYMITYASTAGHNFITPSTPDTIAHYANVTATYGNNVCGYDFGISNNTSFIGGKLFYDDDSDGVLDSTEIGIAYQPISAGVYTVFTDSLGFFNFNVTANNYALIYTPQNAFATYTLTTPNTVNINANTVGGNFSNNNFGIHTTNVGADLGVNLWPTSVVNNGFSAHYTIKYFNNGVTSVNNTLTMTYDSTRIFLNASVPPTTVNASTHTLTWNIPFVNAYTNNYIYVNFTALVALSINTPITSSAHISNSAGTETLLANNTSILNQLSVGSFDPNDKLVIATNTDDVKEQNISSITQNQEIDYVIHFQNVGNYQAINVRIEDEMSTMLDEDSYVLLGGSHNCQVTRENNKVTYKFDNINLPPESENAEGSNGFVSFRINANTNLVEGDIITDIAKIYFDYNQPILTNYANILMVNPSVISDSQSIIITNNNLGVFPNPLSGRGFVKFTLEEDMPVKLTVADMNGKYIIEQNISGKKGMNYYNLDVSNQNTGLYILKVTSEKSTSFHKINIVNK